eukprot:COSAG06_NODE_28332_length_576_cov_1.085954_1_plen_38_part_00
MMAPRLVAPLLCLVLLAQAYALALTPPPSLSLVTQLV